MEVSGYQLKQFLKFLDITQEEASKRLNVSRQTINTWCKLAVLDDSALQNVKAGFSQFENWVANNYDCNSTITEPSSDYRSSDPISQLIKNNTLLAESNARMTETHKILIESNAAMVDSMKKMMDQIIELNKTAKNSHAREDVGCADAG